MHSRRQAESLPFDELASHWLGFFRERVFFTYARCDDCGLLYCPTYFSEEQLARLYASMPDNTAGVDLTLITRTQRRYAQLLLAGSDTTPGDYLELGPDIGLVMAEMLSARRFGHLWLLEPNVRAQPALRERAGATPLTIVESLDGVGAVPERTVACAAAVHVLDHLLEPLPLLRRLAERLTPGASLLAVTHDESSLLARVTRRGWPAYCLQHPQLYRPETLRALLTAAGLEAQPAQRTVNDFPIGYLLQHGLHAVGLRWPWRIPHGPAVPLRLGNMGCVGRRTKS